MRHLRFALLLAACTGCLALSASGARAADWLAARYAGHVTTGCTDCGTMAPTPIAATSAAPTGSCSGCDAGGSCTDGGCQSCGGGCGGARCGSGRGCLGHGCRLGHHGNRDGCGGANGRRNAESYFNCGCNGSYKFPVPPLYTYHWPGLYSQQLMTDYNSPWRFPPLQPLTDEPAPLPITPIAYPPVRAISLEVAAPAPAAGEIESMSSRMERLYR